MDDIEVNLVSMSEIREMALEHLNEEKQKEERQLHDEIFKLYPTYLKVQKMLDDYREKFSVEFDPDLVVEDEKEEDEENDDDLKMFRNFTDIKEKLRIKFEQLPEGQVGCCVCSSRNAQKFCADFTLCHTCIAAKSSYTNQQCNGVLQLLNDCPLRNKLLSKCKRCRMGKIAELKSPYYDGSNLTKTNSPPPQTLPGRYANLMDLREVGTHWYSDDKYDLVDSHCFMVRCINFDEKQYRELSNMCIRVENNDVRLENAYGVQQLTRRQQFSDNDVDNDSVFLVAVDHEMLPWTPDDPKIAVSAYSSMLLVEYLLNPRLNSDPRQSMDTVIMMSRLRSKYITSEFVDKYLAKRGSTSGGWIPTTQQATPLPGPMRGATKGFKGCIYGYIFASGKVNVGSYSRNHPRPHDKNSKSALSKYITKNPEDRYFRVVLCHVSLSAGQKDNKELRLLYEGVFQVISKFAELCQFRLPQLNLPIPPTSKENKTSWPALNHHNLPDNLIVLLNDNMEGGNLTLDQYNNLLQNYSRLLFGRHIKDNWSWENDPLRITVPEPQQD